MCGYLEEYVSATAKVQRSQSKDYEKIFKVGGFSVLTGKSVRMMLRQDNRLSANH
jgi:hypothetical protein